MIIFSILLHKNTYNFLLFIFFNFIVFNFIKSSNILNIKFNRFNFLNFDDNSNLNNNTEFINLYTNSNIYINFTIGSNNQIISMFLYHNFYSIILASNECNYEYYFNNQFSKTFKFLNKNIYNTSPNLKYNIINSTYYSNDYVTIGNKKNILLDFFYVKTFKNDNFKRNILGLKLSSERDYKYYNYYYYNSTNSSIIYFPSLDDVNFLIQIKNKQNINSNLYTLYFYKKNNFFDFKGEFIIGKYMHEIDKKFNEKYLKQKQAGYSLNTVEWIFDFDEVYFGNKILKDSENAKINIEKGMFIGTENFYYLIKNEFFNLNKNNCFEVFYNENNFSSFICDLNVNFSNFKDLKFKIKSENFLFIFTYKDLFTKFKNKYYFLIEFNHIKYKDYSGWILGKIFLQKYTITFNKDNKYFYWYSNENYKKKINLLTNLSLLLNFLLILILIILIYFIINKLYANSRRKKIYELDEDLEYKFKQ